MEGNARALQVGGRATARGVVREPVSRNCSPGRGVVVVVGGGRGREEEVVRRQPPQSQITGMVSTERQKKSAVVKVFKKVQVVYYLTRNGQLEHPHFMEVSHLANQHLRLKDFTDRLTLLRGKGMPSQYSWSCKRSYKNGYVWNDLTDNDIIYPSDGAEYILKGSEIIDRPLEADTDSTKFQHLHKNGNLKLKIFSPSSTLATQSSAPLDHPPSPPVVDPLPDDQEMNNEEDEQEEEKSSYTSSNTPHSRCSRGVSTDDQLHVDIPQNGSNRFDDNNDHYSPPPQSITSSTITFENNAVAAGRRGGSVSNNQSFSSRRIVVVEEGEEDEDGIGGTPLSRSSSSSVLLQLIACGGSVAAKGAGKAAGIPCLRQQAAASKGEGKTTCAGRVGDNKLRRGVVYRAAVAEVKTGVTGEEAVDQEEEEKVMIKYMSENPRFGNLQSEDKEYFSGSILEAANGGGVGGWSHHREAEPTLKKSSSYKEERSCSTKVGGIQQLETPAAEKEERKSSSSGGSMMRGKCIPNPRRKSSTRKQQHRNSNSTAPKPI